MAESSYLRGPHPQTGHQGRWFHYLGLPRGQRAAGVLSIAAGGVWEKGGGVSALRGGDTKSGYRGAGNVLLCTVSGAVSRAKCGPRTEKVQGMVVCPLSPIGADKT